jgi:hypothetical protein
VTCGPRLGCEGQICSGSEEGSYFRLKDFENHSTLVLREVKKKKKVIVWSRGNTLKETDRHREIKGGGEFYFTQSVFNVAFRKTVPTKIRRRILCISNGEG